MLIKHIELNQAQDPKHSGRAISDLYLESESDKIAVEFLSGEGSDMVPLEDLTAEQLRTLVLALAQTYK